MLTDFYLFVFICLSICVAQYHFGFGQFAPSVWNMLQGNLVVLHRLSVHSLFMTTVNNSNDDNDSSNMLYYFPILRAKCKQT